MSLSKAAVRKGTEPQVPSGGHSVAWTGNDADRRAVTAPLNATKQEIAVNNDRIKGAAREMRGSIKEAAGKLTGNTTLQAKGAVQKAAGKVQNAVGKVEDKINH